MIETYIGNLARPPVERGAARGVKRKILYFGIVYLCVSRAPPLRTPYFNGMLFCQLTNFNGGGREVEGKRKKGGGLKAVIDGYASL